MARKPPSPVAGRPLTALFGDEDVDVSAVLGAHLATAPWWRIEDALNQPTANRDDLVEFAAILTVPPTLSAFLVQAATDAETGEGATRAYCGYLLDGQAPDKAYRDIMSGELAVPSLRRLNRARFIAHQAMKIENSSSGPYTAGAWLSWAMGAPSTAKRYAVRALKRHPGHALAGDVLAMARLGERPSWPRPR